jgi:uncharacterized protein (DUF927 family)
MKTPTTSAPARKPKLTVIDGAKTTNSDHDPPPPQGNDEEQDTGFVSWGDFRMNPTRGLHNHKVNRKDQESDGTGDWVCAPFEIAGRCRDPKGNGWGLLLRWKDADHRVHTHNVPRSALHSDPSALCGMLDVGGLTINPGQQRAFRTYLSGCNVKQRVTVVDRTGWHNIGGTQVFVLPNESIGSAGAEHVILDGSAVGPYETKGTLRDWQAGIGELSSEHALPMLAISTSFAGPLLHLTGQEGGGIHIFDISSQGKTTLLQSAASVWGRGEEKGAYVRSWGASCGGLEGVAASASDTLLILDEIGIMEARGLSTSLYFLASGIGRTTLHRDRSLRAPKNWRVLSLSSGEFPIGTKIAEDPGQTVRAGQLVRMLDIHANRGNGFGAFDHGGENDDAGALSNEFKRAATSAYGTAGPEFVHRIVAEGVDGVARKVRAKIDAFVSNVPAGSHGQVKRAAQRLGLIAAAGELAAEYGIVPWEKGDAMEAAEWALKRWIDGRGGTEPAEARQAIEVVQLFIERYGEKWRRGSGPTREWVIPPGVWRTEVCSGLDPQLVAKTLNDRNMLPRSKRSFQVVRKVHGEDLRVYVVTAKIFEEVDRR